MTWMIGDEGVAGDEAGQVGGIGPFIGSTAVKGQPTSHGRRVRPRVRCDGLQAEMDIVLPFGCLGFSRRPERIPRSGHTGERPSGVERILHGALSAGKESTTPALH